MAVRRRVDWEQQADLALDALGRNGFSVLVGDRQVTDLDEVLDLPNQISGSSAWFSWHVPFFAIAGEGGKAAGAPADWSRSWPSPACTTGRPSRSGWPGPWRRGTTLAIPGTSSLAHLGENVAVGTLRLTEEELALLDSLA